MAQCRAGDDGHVQEAGVAEEPPQLCLLRQQLVEHGAVGAVAGVDQDGGHSGRVTAQLPDQGRDVVRLLRLVGGLGQHQDVQLTGAGVRLCQAEEVKVLRHDGLQGLVVVGAGGPVLGAAEVLDGHPGALPAALVQIELRHRLEGQVVHAGEQGVPLPEQAPQIGDLVFLDAVLLRRVVDADEHPELALRRPLQGAEQVVAEPELPLPGGEIVLHGPLRQGLLRLHRHRGAVRPQGVVRRDVLHRQRRAGQVGPGRHAVGPQGVVLVEAEAAVAGGGRQAHHRVQQPDPVVLIGGEHRDQLLQQLQLPQGPAVGEGHRLLRRHGPGVHQPAGEQLVQGEDVPVAPGLLLGQDPFEQVRPVAGLGAVFIEGLAVQGGVVVVRLRQQQLVAQGVRQIHHPLRVVRPVVQGHIGDDRLVRRGALRIRRLRPHRAAARQQRTGQCRRQESSLHRTSRFQKSGARGSAPFVCD